MRVCDEDSLDADLGHLDQNDDQISKKSVQQKVPEELMICYADAVAGPGTVVVHAHDALGADGAVVGAGRPHLLALEAVAPGDEGVAVAGEEGED